MTDGDKTADRGGSHPAEPAKADVNRVAELVRPLPTGHEAARSAEAKSFAELIGLGVHPPALGDQHPEHLAEGEKSFVEKELERRGQADDSASGGSWTERVRILPVEQKQEQERER